MCRVQELNKDSILNETTFEELFNIQDSIKRARLEIQLRDRAKELGIVQKFDRILSSYKQADKEMNQTTREKSKGAKEAFTVEALEAELDIRGISIRYNTITNEMEITWDNTVFSGDDSETVLPTMLRSQLCTEYKYCTKDNIYDYLQYIARKHRYNPVLDFINATKWDGTDRLEELYDIMHIEVSDKLSRRLIVKWFWQGLALLENSKEKGIAPQGVLTLAGDQGIGKTTFFSVIAKLSPTCHYFRSGQSINNYDKDSKRRCLTTFIAELGEIDTTLKSDTGMLKAFITQSFDEYRLPYARSDEKVPRHTNLGASVNGTEFLIDPTGNRRFWTVLVDKIDIDRLITFNSAQLWAQIKEQYYSKDETGFYLSFEEMKLLEERNKGCEKAIKGEDEIADLIYRMKEDADCIYEYITVAEFRDKHPAELGRYTVQQLGRALEKLGYERERKKVNGKTVRVRKLPVVNKEFRVFDNPTARRTS